MFFFVSNALVWISVGRLIVNATVPKMEEVEKEMAVAHGGWVNNGGCWKPTECKARIKVSRLLKLLFIDLSLFWITLHFYYSFEKITPSLSIRHALIPFMDVQYSQSDTTL